MQGKIVVTGATGTLGRAVVEHLLERIDPAEVAVSVRNPDNAAAFAARGVRVRQGDFADPESLKHAFEGAARILLVSADAVGTGVVLHRAAIDAATTTGAERIFYTSHQGANPASAFDAMADHAATETALQASGLPYTSLRNGFYAASALQFLGPALSTGTFVTPEDGRVSWTAHDDLAEAAAVALTSDEALFDDLSPALTGSQALTMDDIAKIASAVGGRNVNHVTVSDEDYVEHLTSLGVPVAQARMLLSIFVASRAGEFAHLDPTLEAILKRPPITVADLLVRQGTQ